MSSPFSLKLFETLKELEILFSSHHLIRSDGDTMGVIVLQL